jgi:hypothetical protein
MTTLTPELKQAIEQAGDEFVRLEDPQTRQTYVLLKADDFERIREILENKWRHASVPRQAVEGAAVRVEEEESNIPEGIRRSQEAFFRDLPELLKDRRLRGKWVAYQSDERVKVGRTQTEVIKECNRRGLKRDQYDVFVIEPQSPEPEEVDYPSAWL